MNSVHELGSHLLPLLQRLSNGQRAEIARKIGRDLRNSHKKRITAQQNPDGTSYVPRRKRLRLQKGRIKRKMFTKIKLNRHLRMNSSSDGITLGFMGRVSRIARVHQFGLRDRAAADAPDTIYSKRELLGFTDDEIKNIEKELLNYIQL